MAEVMQWSGDGLTPGELTTASAGAGDTAPSAVSGAVNIADTGPRPPQLSFEQGASAACYARWTLPSLTKHAGVFYFTTPAAWPSGAVSLAQIDGAADSVGVRIALAGTGTPGQLRLYSSTASAPTQRDQTNQGLIAVSTRYLVKWTCDIASGAVQVLLYSGDGATLIDTLLYTGATWGTAHNRITLGNLSTTPVVAPYAVDDLLVYDTADLPPTPGATPDPEPEPVTAGFFVKTADGLRPLSIAGVKQATGPLRAATFIRTR